ncbi:SDR family NAD(P)-dependent oxidoreductase [Citreimonas salinaria]|uniref:Short-chain dehydrogenase n=1 Tax=Citreimonas salinaria TaxID=321339 RepID=A0A1H3H3J9_9RHOB|nr:SDR family NAD(P)-dependent oxidoreductase [Citreimonas salinaria]SDY09805.1 Short-chain dehydrogenase [Citreimonas salinaria]
MAEKLAVVTGASTGLGRILARLAAEDGHDLVICADEAEIAAARELKGIGVSVESHVADLATRDGIETFWRAIADREIDLFFANAGRALGHAFHDQDWDAVRHRIDLNVLQTTMLLHRMGRKMHARGAGRILVTGSIGGFVPGPYDAVYNATKAYLDSLVYALQDEWRDSPVTLTCLMPGPTETPIFHRESNDLEDTPIADSDSKDDPEKVARAGYKALMKGKRGVVPGWGSKLATMLAELVPQDLPAAVHKRGAKPSSDDPA